MAKTEKRKIGDLGENAACVFLMKQGFSVLERNYLKKCGEIDIVAEKRGILHFIEVKSVSYETTQETGKKKHVFNNGVSYETGRYRPEENMHPGKIRRLLKTIEVYLMENDVSYETHWQVDLVTARLNMTTRRAKMDMIENVAGEW